MTTDAHGFPLEQPHPILQVKEYAKNQTKLDEAFSKVWYKLMTRDMGPVVRCLGKNVPPAQPFQNPLPPASKIAVNYDGVKSDIQKLIDGKSISAADLATLAYQCASTFRVTDYSGGCNGARIRFSPEKDWKSNAGLGKVIKV